MNKPLLKSQLTQLQSRELQPKNGLHRVGDLIAILIRKYELQAEMKRQQADRRRPSRDHVGAGARNQAAIHGPNFDRNKRTESYPVESLPLKAPSASVGYEYSEEPKRFPALANSGSPVQASPIANIITLIPQATVGIEPLPNSTAIQATFAWFQNAE